MLSSDEDTSIGVSESDVTCSDITLVEYEGKKKLNETTDASECDANVEGKGIPSPILMPPPPVPKQNDD